MSLRMWHAPTAVSISVMNSIRFAGLSDPGRVRPRNEDCWLGDARHGLFVVSDGMGGRASGELASKLVVENLPWLLRRRAAEIEKLEDAEASACIRTLLCELSQYLYEQSRGRPGLAGMGATVAMVLIHRTRALIGHLGDSRVYRLERGKLLQLTYDHSIAQYLVDTGASLSDGVDLDSTRDRITRYVAMPGEVLPDVGCIHLQGHERLLLCSDGLTRMVSDPRIAELLVENSDAMVACRALVKAANEAGGQDNTTAVVVDWHVDGNAGELPTSPPHSR